MNIKSLFVAFFLLVNLCFSTVLFAKEARLDNLRDKRYCEILAINWHFLKFKVNVYSTVNLDTCPDNLWKKLDETTIKEQLDATMIKLNGPRYWTIDGMTAYKSSINKPLVVIGGMNFKQRGALDFYIWNRDLSAGPYTKHIVKRHTVWIYKAGTRVYELIDPEGNTYVMQSYAQIINPNLHIIDLLDLEKQLKLPEGWKYQTHILTKPLYLKTDGVAYLIRDDLYNSYTLANVEIS